MGGFGVKVQHFPLILLVVLTTLTLPCERDPHYDSAPSLGVDLFFVVASVCLSVCMYVSVCLSRCSFILWHSTKPSSIFDLGPLTPKIYSPKFGTAQNRL